MMRNIDKTSKVAYSADPDHFPRDLRFRQTLDTRRLEDTCEVGTGRYDSAELLNHTHDLFV